jgi:excisionase family DNA binding protein
VSRRKKRTRQTSKAKSDCWSTPPAIAKKLGVDAHRVLNWIRAGKLAAIDLGDGTRPRYRVSPEALDAYLESRAVTPNPPPSRPRRIVLPNVKQFF